MVNTSLVECTPDSVYWNVYLTHSTTMYTIQYTLYSIWFLYIKMIERKEYIIIYIVFNVWGKYGVPLSVNHVFVNTP